MHTTVSAYVLRRQLPALGADASANETVQEIVLLLNSSVSSVGLDFCQSYA